MSIPVNPQPPLPQPPSKDPAVIAWAQKLGEAKQKLQDPNLGDPNFNMNQLLQWFEQMMGQGQGLPAWANSVSGQQFAEALKAPNIDQEFLVSIIDNWLQSQGISPPPGGGTLYPSE